MGKKEFISETAAKIYAAMFTREDKDPDPKKAIELADELWTLLEEKHSE
ncbi:MAG: hypothetical protein KKA54_16895 [Proteobacteria bacterium]|nr:hypothetical protein [Pseudomonadota bacterium]MBU0968044.1 hypothetical protein [Pseudomonadota bacterium]